MIDATFAPYDHPADQALLGATPMLMAPRFGELPAVSPGQLRYVAASDGVYLQAASHALSACVRVTEGRFPYGTLKPYLRLLAGPIPREIELQAIARARAHAPLEWAGLVILEAGGYRLWEPEGARASNARITYDTSGVDPLSVVLDLHSHGDGAAFFSSQDDSDDTAMPIPCLLTGVIGHCRGPAPSRCLRLVAGGAFHALTRTPFG